MNPHLSREQIYAKLEEWQDRCGVFEHRVRGAEAEAQKLRDQIAVLERELKVTEERRQLTKEVLENSYETIRDLNLRVDKLRNGVWDEVDFAAQKLPRMPHD